MQPRDPRLRNIGRQVPPKNHRQDDVGRGDGLRNSARGRRIVGRHPSPAIPPPVDEQTPPRTTIAEAFGVFLATREATVAHPTYRKYKTFSKQLQAYADSLGYAMLDQFRRETSTSSIRRPRLDHVRRIQCRARRSLGLERLRAVVCTQAAHAPSYLLRSGEKHYSCQVRRPWRPTRDDLAHCAGIRLSGRTKRPCANHSGRRFRCHSR